MKTKILLIAFKIITVLSACSMLLLCACEKKQPKTDMDLLREIAERSVTTFPDLAVILYTTLGSIQDGSINVLSKIAKEYSQSQVNKMQHGIFKDHNNKDLMIRVRIDTLNTLQRI